MTLTEILQNSDFAEIFSGWLRKRLPAEFDVRHEHGIGIQSKNIYVAKEIKYDTLQFIVEVQRLGQTFEVTTLCLGAETEEEFKKIEQVYDHIIEVGSRPEEWAEDNLPRYLE